jgi:hypothetical protein
MAEIPLKVVLDAVNRLSDDIADVKKELEGVKEKSEEADKGVKGFVKALKAAGIVAFATNTAKLTWEFAELGAQAQAIESRFIAFAGGAAEAEEILAAITKTTGGAISELDAMNAATRLLSMGLASNADEASTLINMALRLGDQTEDAGARIENFSLLLANTSIPRLDSFGISASKVRNRIAELRAETPGLSREAAFMTAVMEQGSVSLERLGDSVQSQVTEFERAKAIISDTKTEFMRLVADGITPAVSGFNQLVTFNKRVDSALKENTDSAIKSGTAWEDYARKQFNATAAMKSYEDIGIIVKATMASQGASIQEINAVLEDQNSIYEKAIELGVGYGETLSQVEYEAIIAGNTASAQGFNDVGISAQESAARVNEMVNAQLALNEATAQYQINLNETAAALGEMSQAQVAAAQIEALGQALEEEKITLEEFEAAQRMLLLASGDLTLAESAAQEKINALNQAYIDGKISATEYATAVRDVKNAVDSLQDKTITITVEQRGASIAGLTGGGLSEAEAASILGGRGLEGGGATNTTTNNISITSQQSSSNVVQDLASVGATVR